LKGAKRPGDFAGWLIAWQAQHGRHDLPWQNTRDAYRIWLSEIMLQQTQVTTVLPYYARFLERFPDIRTLAAAPVDEVMALWSGLGYYARARNLHACARAVVERHGGEFPRETAAIAALPGIGRSTAAAIAAFAHGTRGAILDGNVKRVLARCFGIDGFPGTKKVENHLWQLAESLLPGDGIETYTQALMDLGATVCTRGKPDCAHCPLRGECIALEQDRVGELPTPRPRKTVPQRSARFLILRHDDRVLLELRPPSGIWGALLCLPELTEGDDPRLLARRRYACSVDCIDVQPPLTHRFTHFTLTLQPLLCRVSKVDPHAAQPGVQWLDLDALDRAALPAPIRKLLAR
jgi:A/G-specific adenine glycosylase